MATFASVDIGTNTALLLIAAVSEEGQIRTLYQEQQFVRLGENLSRTGIVGIPALSRLDATLRDYAKKMDRYSPEQIQIAGTSASRDAGNQDEIREVVRAATRQDFRVLSGREEAKITFAGATTQVPTLEGPCCVIDIGGGSTEVIIGPARSTNPESSVSIQAGSVRLTEMFFRHSPPLDSEVEALDAHLDRLFKVFPLSAPETRRVAAVAGTATALALLEAGAMEWTEPQDGTPILSKDKVAGWVRLLSGLSAGEIQAINPVILKGRADVFTASVLILDRFMKNFGIPEVLVSSGGVRHGLIIEMWNNRNLFR